MLLVYLRLRFLYTHVCVRVCTFDVSYQITSFDFLNSLSAKPTLLQSRD